MWKGQATPRALQGQQKYGSWSQTPLQSRLFPIRPGFLFKNQAGCATWLLPAGTTLCFAPWEPPTNQNCLEGETLPQSPPGVPGRPALGGSASLLHRGSHRTEGHAEPQWGKVLTAPWGGTHVSGGCCSRLGCFWGNGFALGDGPCLQPTSTAERMQPTEPPTEQRPIAGLKNGRKISLTHSWVWKRAGASHADHPNFLCGRSPRAAGNSTQRMMNAFIN